MYHSFLDREFVSQWSSGTVFVGKNTAVQSLKHLWFSVKYPLFKVSRDPQWKGCLLIVLTNILTSCLNIQTLLSQKTCDSVWLLLCPSLQTPVSIMTLQIFSLLQQPLVQNVEKGKTWTKEIFKLGSLSVAVLFGSHSMTSLFFSHWYFWPCRLMPCLFDLHFHYQFTSVHRT